MKESLTTLSARVVGCVCLVGSIMLMTQIAVDVLNSKDGKFSNTSKWSIESLEFWTVHHSHQFINRESHLIAIGAYVMFYCICSALLVFATYMYWRLMALPWLFAEASCVLCEVSSLISYFAGDSKSDPKHVAVAVFCLAVGITMWCIVYDAQVEWKKVFTVTSPPPPPYTVRSSHSLEEPPNAGTPTRRSKTTVV